MSCNHPDVSSSRPGTGEPLIEAEAVQAIDWPGRLNATTARTLNTRSARNQQRQELNEARTAGLFGAPIGRRTMWLIVVLRCPAPRCRGVHHHRAASLKGGRKSVTRRCPSTGYEYVVTATVDLGGARHAS